MKKLSFFLLVLAGFLAVAAFKQPPTEQGSNSENSLQTNFRLGQVYCSIGGGDSIALNLFRKFDNGDIYWARFPADPNETAYRVSSGTYSYVTGGVEIVNFSVTINSVTYANAGPYILHP